MHHFIYFSVSEEKPMTPPSAEGMAKMGRFMEESFKSGKVVATGQLPRQTTYVELDNGNFSISDGPFIEGKELIPGFTIIRTETRDEAVEWAKELRKCMGDGIVKLAKLSATGPEAL